MSQSIQSQHVIKLLEMLDQHRKLFFAPTIGPEPQRIYFIDTDVMYVYIDGTVRGKKHVWANPITLSLEPGRVEKTKKYSLGDEAENLIEAIGQAISRFLFGQFNDQLVAQQKRFYVTPEHERELRAISLGVLHHAAADPHNWQEALKNQYLRLCKEKLSVDDALTTAESIVEALCLQSSFGKVPRANALYSDYISKLSTNIITPGSGNGASLLFFQQDPGYMERFETLKDKFFDIFLEVLKKLHPESEVYFPLKRMVYQLHGPEIPLRHYVDKVRQDENLRASLDLSELDNQVVIAATQSNDVASLARIAGLSAYLNNDHKLSDGTDWETCLISGSRNLQSLLEELQNHETLSDDVRHVRIIHPICFLRHPSLYDPQGVNALLDPHWREKPDEQYALTTIFNASDEKTSVTIEGYSTGFVRGLTRMLHGVITREAQNNDRSLRNFWRSLSVDPRFNDATLQDRVRYFVAYHFTDTFVKLTELSSEQYNRLSSMPTIDVMHSPSALRILSDIRTSTKRRKRSRPDSITRVHNPLLKSKKARSTSPSILGGKVFENVLNEDPTGYSAMLCAAVGYIARGWDWLNAAQTMTSTAVMLAIGRSDISSYPQGDEALYLRSFLSRFLFDPGNSEFITINHWLDHQMETLKEADDALHEWRHYKKEAADAEVSEYGCSRYELNLLKHKVEGLMSRVYALVWKILDDREHIDEQEEPFNLLSATKIFEDCCDQLLSLHSLSQRPVKFVDEGKKTLISEHQVQAFSFISSQLWAATLQCWLCLHFTRINGVVSYRAIDEKSILDIVSRNEVIVSNLLPEYLESQPDETGLVVDLIKETFAVEKLELKKGTWKINLTSFDEERVAAIDPLRFKFFRECWSLV